MKSYLTKQLFPNFFHNPQGILTHTILPPLSLLNRVYCSASLPRYYFSPFLSLMNFPSWKVFSTFRLVWAGFTLFINFFKERINHLCNRKQFFGIMWFSFNYISWRNKTAPIWVESLQIYLTHWNCWLNPSIRDELNF